MRNRLTILLLAICALFCCSARAERVYTPSQMENVNVANRYDFVSDPGGYMSAGAKNSVNERLWRLRQSTSAEVAVAIVPSIGDMPIEDFSEKLFTDWGLGKSDKDNGVLLVIAMEQRRARIQTGYGAEGVLPDVSCAKIIRNSIVPAMKEGNLDKAVEEATADIYAAMTDPAVAAELKSDQSDNFAGATKVLSTEVIWQFIEIVAFCAFLFALGLFVYDMRAGRRLDPYEKTLMWRRHLPTYWGAAALSLGAGLVFALLALWRYRTVRTRPRKCDTCGHKMKRLGEEEDNALLTPSQDFEEKLKTVDYDVWECPHCGTVERFPFKARQVKYSKCPSCGTIAMGLKYDKTVVPPTTRHAGEGERVYECLFCHHQQRTRYRIPKKDDGAATAAILGAAVGSALGSRRGGGGGFGGGGFGGGFGGGSTGGGGASGGW